MKRLVILILFVLMSTLSAQLRPFDFRFEKEKVSLNKVNDPTPLGNSITDIIVDVNGTVWLGTSRGLSKSTDNGESWTNYLGHPDFGSDGIISLGFYNGEIWCTTGKSTEIAGGSTLPEGTGIKYSTDNGDTWTSFDQPVDDPADSLITYGNNQIRALPVTTTVQNISYDIEFTQGAIWITSFAGGLRKSTDKGVTWQRVLLPPDDLNSISPDDTLNFTLQPVAGAFGDDNNLNHRLFSVIGINDTTLYVGTAGGINKSTDNGTSWVKFSHQNQENPISGNFVTALGFSYASNAIWAATWKAEDQDENWGVSASFDGGNSWETFLPGERAHNFGFKFFDASFRSDVFVPTDNGLYRSDDNGRTWVSPPAIVDDFDGEAIKTNIFYSVTANRVNSDSTDVWIGTAKGLAKVRESNDSWSGQWNVIKAKRGEKETYAFPNPFSPNIDNGLITIIYPVNTDGAKVSIRIFDFGMNLVRTVSQNKSTQKNTKAEEFWNGKDENGRTVANGVYFYRVVIDDSEPLYGKIMVLK
jgi:hypothetical protein